MKALINLFSGKAYRPDKTDINFPLAKRFAGKHCLLIVGLGKESVIWEVETRNGEITSAKDPFTTGSSERVNGLITAYLNQQRVIGAKSPRAAGVLVGVPGGSAVQHEIYPAFHQERDVGAMLHGNPQRMLGKDSALSYNQEYIYYPIAQDEYKRTVFFQWRKKIIQEIAADVGTKPPLARIQGVAASVLRYLYRYHPAELKKNSLIVQDGETQFILLTDSEGRWLYGAFPEGYGAVDKLRNALDELGEGGRHHNESFIIASIYGETAERSIAAEICNGGFRVNTVPVTGNLFVNAILAD